MSRSIPVVVLSLAFAITLACASAGAAEWGNLSGRFIYDGKPPAPQKVNVDKDKEFCGKTNLVEETLVVGKDQGLGNVILYLYLKRKDKVAIHPSYEKIAGNKVLLNNDKCRFEPHVSLLWTKQTLVLGNLDRVGHNTKIDLFNNNSVNPIIPAGAQLDQKFEVAERLPVRVSCSIHPWMSAWVVVKDNPYSAVSGADGKFEIKNLPAGKLKFQAWHEKSGYVKTIKLGGKKKTWKKGRFTVTIKPGETTDLGDIRVSPSLFKK